MRGIKAKRIRQAVYGNLSQRGRTYVMVGTSIVNTGKRAEYQKAKRAA